MRLAAGFVLCLLATPVLAQSGAAITGPKPEPEADAAMMESMQKMNRGMTAMAMTGDPDHDFAAMMIPHHQGAIDMAQFELAHGKDPALRAMAQRIIADQEKEIGEFKAWLAKH